MQTFKTKFNNAARQFNIAPNQVISLKLRETVSSYTEYQHLLDILEREAGIRWQKINEDLQGTGYLLTFSNSKVIIVEHETGLEILYIAGSIASVIGLIPLILQCWSRIRGHHDFPHPSNFRSIEICRLDSKNRLHEEKTHGLTILDSTPLSIINTTLVSAAGDIETEIQRLRQEIYALTVRINALEKKNSQQVGGRKKTKKRIK